jgi:hypothetical protein
VSGAVAEMAEERRAPGKGPWTWCAAPGCCACNYGVCSWCGHDDCPDPAHGDEPGHGENSPCQGCAACDEYFGEDEP